MKRSGVLGVACTALIAIALNCTPANAQQKTAKQCNAEWAANKAAIQASGKTKKAFVAECRGTAAATAAPAQPTPSQPTPSQPSSNAPAPNSAPTTAARPRQTYSTASAPTGAGQYGSETAAKTHCPRDTVVWANLDSKIYHFAGNRDYGNTKHGAYMCEREAEGFRAAKNEKHP
jgi:hypothetical protein